MQLLGKLKISVTPSFLSDSDNKKRGSLNSFFSNKHLKLNLRVFLTGYTVTIVTCYIIKEKITCSLMNVHLFDTIIVAYLFPLRQTSRSVDYMSGRSRCYSEISDLNFFTSFCDFIKIIKICRIDPPKYK